MALLHQGGCACGAIRYQVRGSPRICQICHCRFCQRRTGTAFGTVAYFSEEDVTLLEGKPRTYEHSSDETGRWLRTEFCLACGTTVMQTAQIRPGLRGIAVGTLDEPEWPAIQRHIWTRSKRSWTAIPEGTPTFPQGAPPSAPDPS